MYDRALKGRVETVAISKFSFNRCSHSCRRKNISHGNAMFADASGPCTSPNSGSEILKSTGSWCRYLKITVEIAEKNGSVEITLPPDFNLLAARSKNAIGLLR